MIRTVWLAIACLIGLVGLMVLKVGTASFVQEAAAPSEQAALAIPASDIAVADALPKGDRLDAADQDEAVKPVRPIAITTKLAAAVPAEITGSESGWRRSYAKREAGSVRHRKGKLHKTSRRHRAHAVSRSHGKSQYGTARKKKSRR
jgi:Flp pilus assembly protein CpaB